MGGWGSHSVLYRHTPALGSCADFQGVAGVALSVARIHEMRGGKDYDSHFAMRMKGSGLWADLIRRRFEKNLPSPGL